MQNVSLRQEQANPQSENPCTYRPSAVRLEGVVNLRDMGGYRTTSGRRVRCGVVFRSDHLARLSGNDQARLMDLGVRLVVDLRTRLEAGNLPDRLPADGSIPYLHLPVESTRLDPVYCFDRVREGDTGWLTWEFLLDGYLKSLDAYGHVWGEVFRRLTSGGGGLLFHCTGGKDRTGVCAALLLLALGVPEPTVLYDYSLSNVYNLDRIRELHTRIRSWGVDPARLSPYLTAPRYLLVNLLRHLRARYGTVERYLAGQAGVDRQLLREFRRKLLV